MTGVAEWNDACPQGDPGCDAPDDGEWYAHDGCTLHPDGVPDPQALARLADAFAAVSRRWSPDGRTPAAADRPT